MNTQYSEKAPTLTAPSPHGQHQQAACLNPTPAHFLITHNVSDFPPPPLLPPFRGRMYQLPECQAHSRQDAGLGDGDPAGGDKANLVLKLDFHRDETYFLDTEITNDEI